MSKLFHWSHEHKDTFYAVIAGVIGECVIYKKITRTVTQDLDNG